MKRKDKGEEQPKSEKKSKRKVHLRRYRDVLALPRASEQPELRGVAGEGVGVQLGLLLLALSTLGQDVHSRVGDHHLLDGRLDVKGLQRHRGGGGGECKGLGKDRGQQGTKRRF